MTFDWREYLTLAQSLVNNTPARTTDDAAYRTAISRAYYAAFHVAKLRLKEKDYDRNIPQGETGGRVHKYVRDTFTEHPFPERKQIGLNLGTLLQYRGRADYEPVFKRLPDTAMLSVKLAEETIDMIQALR